MGARQRQRGRSGGAHVEAEGAAGAARGGGCFERPSPPLPPHGGLAAAAGPPPRPPVCPAVPLRQGSSLLPGCDGPAGGEVAGDPAAAGGEVRAASSSPCCLPQLPRGTVRPGKGSSGDTSPGCLLGGGGASLRGQEVGGAPFFSPLRGLRGKVGCQRGMAAPFPLSEGVLKYSFGIRLNCFLPS